MTATYAYAETRNYECDTYVPDYMDSSYKDIARQLVEEQPGNKMNVIFGGGRDFLGASIDQVSKVKFKGGAEKSCNRSDGENLVEKYLRQFDNKTNVQYIKNSGELIGLDCDKVDQVLGLFSNNHMSYDSLRDRGSEGEPSIAEMTKAAIKILNNQKNKSGFVLMIEGGRIDQAHHQNHARLALEEMLAFEQAIQEAVEMSLDDTLIIVTADHAHSMIFNGYPQRGADILDSINKVDVPLYETLVRMVYALIVWFTITMVVPLIGLRDRTRLLDARHFKRHKQLIHSIGKLFAGATLRANLHAFLVDSHDGFSSLRRRCGSLCNRPRK